jgi:hypothetical protein
LICIPEPLAPVNLLIPQLSKLVIIVVPWKLCPRTVVIHSFRLGTAKKISQVQCTRTETVLSSFKYCFDTFFLFISFINFLVRKNSNDDLLFTRMKLSLYQGFLYSVPFCYTMFAVGVISTTGKNCQKGSLALGKFLLQKHSPPAEEDKDVVLKNIPQNNPFKKRKLTTIQGQGTDQNELLLGLHGEESALSCSSLSLDSSYPNKIVKVLSVDQGECEELNSLMNEAPVSFCSSLVKQSVKSLRNRISSTKQKYTKSSTNKRKTSVNESSGILRFFTRL